MITTTDKSVGEINYQLGTIARIGPNSSVEVPSHRSLKQNLGQIYLRFAAVLGIRDTFAIDTPAAVATIRGTSLLSFVSASKQTTFVALDHPFEIATKTSPTKFANLSPDFQALISLNKSTIATTAAQLTFSQTNWLIYNQQLDSSGSADPNLSLFLPTPTPTVTPTPKATPVPTLPPISTMPGAGYTRSSVTTTSGTTHTLWCAGANKNQVRVVTDSGNDSDCRNDCTVMPLADYVSRNGGWAGMHGAYACPADYPACADKKNSFDTLFFNSRVKRYLNSDNNIYSVVPLVIVDTSGNTRFMSKSLEWGRDTNIQAGVASHPMLVMGKSYAINDGNLDSKQRSTKSTRGAFVQSGDNLYLCVVGNATVVDSANVFLKLGADNALNLDGGGTTALYINGRYVLGPGRALTNAIIFANK